MKDEPLAVWSETLRTRWQVMRTSGGFKGLFFTRFFFGTGMFLVLLVLLVWCARVASGESAASPQKLVVILVLTDAAIALIECAVFLLVPKVQIGSRYFRVGGIEWLNSAFRSVAWTTLVIDGAERQILILTAKFSRRVAVAIPADRSKHQMEELLRVSGIEK